jgi:hypothetical protein
VWTYLRRASITPASLCERCGAGSAVFFHPDPAVVREIVWLCKSCRKRVRATGEPVTLTWVWPGELGEVRRVVPVERPERRPRRDRSAPSPSALPSPAAGLLAPVPLEPFDDEAVLARIDAALATRFAEVEAINARVAGALAGLRDRQRGEEP